MLLQKLNVRTIVLVLMMVAVAAMRLLTHQLSLTYPYAMSNFTPFGAIALFGGSYFKHKWKAYTAVMLTLFLSDIVINYLNTSKFQLWYNGSEWVYIIFALMVFIGTFIKKVNIVNVAMASLITVSVHWLIIDLPWLYGTLYAHTIAGYWQSLIASLPFERNMLLADVLFCAMLFGGFEWAKNRYAALRPNKELAV